MTPRVATINLLAWQDSVRRRYNRRCLHIGALMIVIFLSATFVTRSLCLSFGARWQRQALSDTDALQRLQPQWQTYARLQSLLQQEHQHVARKLVVQTWQQQFHCRWQWLLSNAAEQGQWYTVVLSPNELSMTGDINSTAAFEQWLKRSFGSDQWQVTQQSVQAGPNGPWHFNVHVKAR